MSTNNGLFYAYAKNINDDWSARYLITFATRDVADAWYRAVTDSVAKGYMRFAGVQRVASQFYTHDEHITDTITDAQVALHLRGQIFFTLLNDKNDRIFSIIPVLNYDDRRSGYGFYIRSVSHPDSYWYYDSLRIVASRDRRTRFTITMADRTRAAGTIMISSDDIYITVHGANIGVANQHNQLSNSTNPFPFKLSSLNGDFQVTDFFSDGNATYCPISRNPGKGEKWELV